MRRRQRCRARDGMTLIEVILALAILGISVLSLLTATMRCLAAVRLARNYQGARAALDKAELEHPLNRTVDVRENAVTDRYGLYEFARTIEETGEEDLFIVRTRITWSDKGARPYEEVVGYLYSTNHF